MTIRISTLVAASVASILTLGSANAQTTHAERALNYVLGTWINPNSGANIRFFISRDIPKVRIKAQPEVYLEGGYKASEEGGDIMVTFPPGGSHPSGLRCYFDVDTVSSSDIKEIVIRFRGSNSESGAKECRIIEGTFHRGADRD
jgi:hypothetical protein